MVRKAIVAAALLAAGCNYIPGADATKIAEAEKAVAAKLNDPASAQFQNTFVGTINRKFSGPQEGVCGEINGKNGFGGYVGFRRFVAQVGGEEIHIDPQYEGSGAMKAAEELCESTRGAVCQEQARLSGDRAAQHYFDMHWADYCTRR